MSFEIQELLDVIKIITLLNLQRARMSRVGWVKLEHLVGFDDPVSEQDSKAVVVVDHVN